MITLTAPTIPLPGRTNREDASVKPGPDCTTAAIRGDQTRLPRTARLFRAARRALQQLRQLLLPEFRLGGGAVAGGLVTRGDQQDAAVLHPLDLAIQQAELWRVALVVRRVDHQQNRLAALHAPGRG